MRAFQSFQGGCQYFWVVGVNVYIRKFLFAIYIFLILYKLIYFFLFKVARNTGHMKFKGWWTYWRSSNYTPVLFCPWLSLFCPWLSRFCPWLSLFCPCFVPGFTSFVPLFVGQEDSVAALCSLSLTMVEVGATLHIPWIKGGLLLINMVTMTLQTLCYLQRWQDYKHLQVLLEIIIIRPN